MSDGGRERNDPTLKWVLPLVGIVLAISLAWGFGYLQSRETEHRYHTPKSYQQSAKAYAQRACVGMKSDALLECVNEQIESGYQQANAEQDLKAQQRAASSALIAAIVSALALGATIIGIYYVRETLRATLKAVEDTSKATAAMEEQNRITRNAQRAWVSISATPQKVVFFKNSIRFYYVISITNVGGTVAQSIDLRHHVFDGNGDDVSGHVARKVSDWERVPRQDDTAIMPGETVSSNLWSFEARSKFTEGENPLIGPAILVHLRYRLEGEDKDRISRKIFRYGERRDTESPLGRNDKADPVVHYLRSDASTLRDDTLVLNSFGGVAT